MSCVRVTDCGPSSEAFLGDDVSPGYLLLEVQGYQVWDGGGGGDNSSLQGRAREKGGGVFEHPWTVSHLPHFDSS